MLLYGCLKSQVLIKGCLVLTSQPFLLPTKKNLPPQSVLIVTTYRGRLKIFTIKGNTMAIQTTRQCLCCGNPYHALSAKKFLCGARSCYRQWHKDRQALKLSITEYKDLCRTGSELQIDLNQPNPKLTEE